MPKAEAENRLEHHVDQPLAYRAWNKEDSRPLKPADIGHIVALAEFNPQLLKAEEEKLGLKFEDNPRAFTMAHNSLVSRFQKRIREIAPGAKETTLDSVAKHLSRGDELAYRRWRRIFNSRLTNYSGEFSIDHLQSATWASSSYDTRTIEISSLLALLEDSTSDELIRGTLIPHEIIHLLLAQAVTKYGPKNSRRVAFTRDGIDIEDINVSGERTVIGEWLNEAFIEDLRSNLFGDKHRTGYKRAVAVLRALKSVDPNLETALEEAAFESPGPAPAIGRVEAILGPLAVEKMEMLLKSEWDPVEKKKDYVIEESEFVASVTNLVVDGEHKEQFRNVLTHELESIVWSAEFAKSFESYHQLARFEKSIWQRLKKSTRTKNVLRRLKTSIS